MFELKFPSILITSLLCLIIISTMVIQGSSSLISQNLLSPNEDRKIGGIVITIDCTCGRVYNYTSAGKGKMPWTARIVKRNDPKEYAICWGSLINDRYVLTAANCVIGLNPTNLAVILDSNSSFTHRIANVKPHPLYSPRKGAHDNNIALIKLKTSLNFTTNQGPSPVCLPPEPPAVSLGSEFFSGRKNRTIKSINDSKTGRTRFETFLETNEDCDYPFDAEQGTRVVMGISKERSGNHVNGSRGETRLTVLETLDPLNCEILFPTRVQAQFHCGETIQGGEFIKGCNPGEGSPLVYLRRFKEGCDPDFNSDLKSDQDILRVRLVQTGISTKQEEDCALPSTTIDREGRHKANSKKILLFLRVSRYRKWIRENTSDAVYCWNTPK